MLYTDTMKRNAVVLVVNGLKSLQGTKLRFVDFADFSGVNIPIMDNFNLPR